MPGLPISQAIAAAAAALHLKASLAAMRQTPQRKIILSVSQVLLQAEAMLLPTAAFMAAMPGPAQLQAIL